MNGHAEKFLLGIYVVKAVVVKKAVDSETLRAACNSE